MSDVLFAWGGGRHLLRTVAVSGFFAGLLIVLKMLETITEITFNFM